MHSLDATKIRILTPAESKLLGKFRETFQKLHKHLSSNSTSYQDVVETFKMIERFKALIYKGTTNALTVDKARREIFVKDSRDLETIPSTSAAVFEHTLQVSYIGGYV